MPSVVGVSIRIDDPTFASASLLMDGTAVASFDSIGAWATANFEAAGLTDGSRTFTIRVITTTGAAVILRDSFTVTFDGTPPTATFAPVPGSRNVVIKNPITVHFSEPVSRSRVDGGIRFLSSTGPYDAHPTLSLSPDNQTLTFQVSGGGWQDIDVVGTVEAYDLAGNPLDAGPWTWRAPTWLETGTLEALPGATDTTMPKLAAGRNGDIALAWLEGSALWLAQWSDAGWQLLDGGLSPPGGSAVAGYSLAVDPSGLPVVAYGLSGCTSCPITVARRDGGGWTTEGTLTVLALGSAKASSPSLALTETGTAVVAFEEVGGIHVLLEDSAGGWRRLDGGYPSYGPWRGDAGFPSVATGDGGTLFLAYQQDTSTKSAVYAYAWRGTYWGELAALNYLSEEFWHPVITAGDLARPCLTYEMTTATSSNATARVSCAGTTSQLNYAGAIPSYTWPGDGGIGFTYPAASTWFPEDGPIYVWEEPLDGGRVLAAGAGYSPYANRLGWPISQPSTVPLMATVVSGPGTNEMIAASVPDGGVRSIATFRYNPTLFQ